MGKQVFFYCLELHSHHSFFISEGAGQTGQSPEAKSNKTNLLVSESHENYNRIEKIYLQK